MCFLGGTITKNRYSPLNIRIMVPVGGLEPPRLSTVDFESTVYTNFTTPAKACF